METEVNRMLMTKVLNGLPMSAAVAFATRCARRVQIDSDFMLKPEWGKTIQVLLKDSEAFVLDTEKSINRSYNLEGLVQEANHIVAVTGDWAWAARKNVESSANSSALDRGRYKVQAGASFYAAQAVASAVGAGNAALYAAKRDPLNCINVSLYAYDRAVEAVPAMRTAAVIDLKEIVELNLGLPATPGGYFDPGESGPLGSFWPHYCPDWRALPPSDGDLLGTPRFKVLIFRGPRDRNGFRLYGLNELPECTEPYIYAHVPAGWTLISAGRAVKLVSPDLVDYWARTIAHMAIFGKNGFAAERIGPEPSDDDIGARRDEVSPLGPYSGDLISAGLMSEDQFSKNKFDRNKLFYPFAMNYQALLFGFKELTGRGIGSIGREEMSNPGGETIFGSDHWDQLTLASLIDSGPIEVLPPLILRSSAGNKFVEIEALPLCQEIANYPEANRECLKLAAGSMLGLAFEAAKLRNFHLKTPLWEFLRHCRNAAMHDGRFNFIGDEPKHPAEWARFRLDKTMHGKPLLIDDKNPDGLLDLADPLHLLWDIEQAYPTMMIVRNIPPAT